MIREPEPIAPRNEARPARPLVNRLLELRNRNRVTDDNKVLRPENRLPLVELPDDVIRIVIVVEDDQSTAELRHPLDDLSDYRRIGRVSFYRRERILIWEDDVDPEEVRLDQVSPKTIDQPPREPALEDSALDDQSRPDFLKELLKEPQIDRSLKEQPASIPICEPRSSLPLVEP